jgi:hypothetical protein
VGTAADSVHELLMRVSPAYGAWYLSRVSASLADRMVMAAAALPRERGGSAAEGDSSGSDSYGHGEGGEAAPAGQSQAAPTGSSYGNGEE